MKAENIKRAAELMEMREHAVSCLASAQRVLEEEGDTSSMGWELTQMGGGQFSNRLYRVLGPNSEHRDEMAKDFALIVAMRLRSALKEIDSELKSIGIEVES